MSVKRQASAVGLGFLLILVAASANSQASALNCGDVDCSGATVATDALAILRAAVGFAQPLRCGADCSAAAASANQRVVVSLGACGDLNCDSSVTATDALSALRASVGQDATLFCQDQCFPPAVVIDSPTALSLFATPAITVSGTVPEGTSVSCNDVAAAISASLFTADVGLREGNNTITCVAVKPSGATATASIQVTLDTKPPIITIAMPPDRFATMSQSISVAGIINDIVVGTVNDEQASVSVNGVAASVANRGYLATAIPLQIGENTITAVGHDRVGNAASTSIVVVREESMGAMVRPISGDAQTGVISGELPGPLIVELDDTAGNPVVGENVIFKVTGNSGTLSGGGMTDKRSIVVVTDAAGRAEARWKLGSRSGAGNNVVEAKAIAFAGMGAFTATALAAAPTFIVMDSGSLQRGVAGQALAQPFVAVVTDHRHNRLAGVDVAFSVIQGTGTFGGLSDVTVTTDTDGRAQAILTLGADEGFDNNLVEATFVGNAGFPASFVASTFMPGNPSNTVVAGIVLDNTDNPVAGVTIRLGGTCDDNASASASTTTNSQGQFRLLNAPVGELELIADGSSVADGQSWPCLAFDLVTVPGRENGIGMPIHLLPIADDMSQPNVVSVDETTGGMITLPGLPGFELEIVPGSVTFPDGGKQGIVSATLVHADKIPMTPSFGLQPRAVVTIQPTGALFTPPARLTLPNVDGLAPGAVTEFYSFDHDLGQFVSIGTGTVSQDGMVIASDPGVGIVKGGWHCGGDPSASGAAGGCPECQKCDTDQCVPDSEQDGSQCRSNPCLVCSGGACVFPMPSSNNSAQILGDQIPQAGPSCGNICDPEFSDIDCPVCQRCDGTQTFSSCVADDSQTPVEPCKVCKNGEKVDKADSQISKEEGCCGGKQYNPRFFCCQSGSTVPKYPIRDLAECPNRVASPLAKPQKHDPDENFCTDVPAAPFVCAVLGIGVSFNSACKRHDDCYADCKADKDSCDRKLGEDAAKLCMTLTNRACRAECLAGAFTFFDAVRRIPPTLFYEPAQKAACQCCE